MAKKKRKRPAKRKAKKPFVWPTAWGPMGRYVLHNDRTFRYVLDGEVTDGRLD